MAIGYERTWHDQPRDRQGEGFREGRSVLRGRSGSAGLRKGPAFPGVQAFVAEDGSAVWVSTAAEGDAVAPIHVAFQAADNDAVKAFYEAGLANGGTDNGEPGPRPNYGPTYYAAFVHDPEGNNIEAMLA